MKNKLTLKGLILILLLVGGLSFTIQQADITLQDFTIQQEEPEWDVSQFIKELPPKTIEEEQAEEGFTEELKHSRRFPDRSFAE